VISRVVGRLLPITPLIKHGYTTKIMRLGLLSSKRRLNRCRWRAVTLSASGFLCYNHPNASPGNQLTRVHGQGQPNLIAAIHDARFGRCTDAVQSLMDERSVTNEAYKALQYKVLHIVPRHEEVDSHNEACLRRLFAGAPPTVSFSIHEVKEDPKRDRNVDPPNLGSVSAQACDAALIKCVAPRRVEHGRGARVMLTCNHFVGLGLYHGSIGHVVDYEVDGTPVVRFEEHELPEGTPPGRQGVRGAGAD